MATNVMSRREKLYLENPNMFHRRKPKLYFSADVPVKRMTLGDFTKDNHEDNNVIIDDVVVGLFYEENVDKVNVFVMFEDIETFERYWFHIDIFTCESLMVEAGLTEADIERLVEVK